MLSGLSVTFLVTVLKYPNKCNLRAKGSFGSQFTVIVHHCREVTAQELEEAGHIVTTVKKQGETNACALLNIPLLYRPGP